MRATVAAIDNAKFQLAQRLGSLSPGIAQQVQSEIIALSVKEGQIQGAFLKQAMQSAEIIGAIAALSKATNSMNSESEKIAEVEDVINSVSTILQYAGQAFAAIAPFLAL
jgi:hypothetical protein